MRLLSRFFDLVCLIATVIVLTNDLPAQIIQPGSTAILTKAAQVHDLPAGRAPGTRVHLVGTITYYDPLSKVMFLQDETGAAFIDTDRPYPVNAGDLVEVYGQAEASYRTEVAMDPTIRVIGRGHIPLAPYASYRDLAAGQRDCKLVTIQGRVLAADAGEHAGAPVGHLDVALANGEVEIYVNSSVDFHPDTLLDAEVRITGVAGGSFDAKAQLTGLILYVQEPSAVRITRNPPSSVRHLPVKDINAVFESLNVRDTSPRVRVQGTVTYYKQGYSAVLQNGSKSIYIQTRQTTGLAVGDVADAYGFASNNGYAPGLREAVIVRTGSRAPLAPRTISYAEALSGVYSDNLVSLSGQLVSELHDVGSDTLVLNVNGHLMSAYLEGSSSLDAFVLGSLVRVVGICRVLPGNPWQAPYTFHLDMRTKSDAEQIGAASWWTIRHLVTLLSASAIAALVIAIWAMVLRGRVLKQTRRITRSMAVADQRSKLLGKISSNQSSPEQLLSEICASVETLLPGTNCCYSLAPSTESPANAGEERNKQTKLFEVILTGPGEEVLGQLAAFTQMRKHLLSYQQEVHGMVREVATLAIRQSLMYEKLVHHSTHDPLTNLPNRRLFESRLTEALKEAERQGSRLLVIYIDVDHFKQVNDQYGHKVGDTYLGLISKRLLAQIRSQDTLARIGGDEFIVIAPFKDGLNGYQDFVGRLQACFDTPFHIDGASIDGSASFGVARYPEHGITAEDLKRNADQAMYLAKQSEARKTDTTIEISVITPHELELALRKDLFRLVYQPQFSSEGRLTGLEALLRLEDPILGTLTPDAFISVAERYEVIHDIGKWVLERAVQDAMRWNLHEGDEIALAVNVSVSQMRHAGFTQSVLACLEKNGFPTERLELELIERSLMSSSSEVTRQLELLRNAGVRISLDDFGTGQSCLSMLHRLPVDTIKLDRAFIQAMDDAPKVLPIIRAITSMAHSLGKRVVAEGLEHVGSVPVLLEMGDMDFQGYLLSKPVPAQEVDKLIRSWRSGIALPVAFRQRDRPLDHQREKSLLW